MQLAGKILIAMPGMADPRFSRSVVLICAHSDDGAMGLVLNKPIRELNFHSFLEQIGIKPTPAEREIRIHFGGPVEQGRGFVLHSTDWTSGEATMIIPGGFSLTGTIDILEELAGGRGPESALVALGYAGWGEGQLESEIRRNDWLIADVTRDLAFRAEDDQKWAEALKVLGIDPIMLSGKAGHA